MMGERQAHLRIDGQLRVDQAHLVVGARHLGQRCRARPADATEGVGPAAGAQVHSVQRAGADEAPEARHQGAPASAGQPAQAARPDRPDHRRGPEGSTVEEGRDRFIERDRRSRGRAFHLCAAIQLERRSRRLAHEGGEVEAHPGGDRLAEVAEGVQVRISAEPIAPLMLQQPALETTGLGRPVVHRQPLDDHDHLGDPRSDCVCREPIVRERRAGEPGVRRHNGGHVGYDPLDVIASTGRPECPVLDAYVDRKRAAVLEGHHVTGPHIFHPPAHRIEIEEAEGGTPRSAAYDHSVELVIPETRRLCVPIAMVLLAVQRQRRRSEHGIAGDAVGGGHQPRIGAQLAHLDDGRQLGVELAAVEVGAAARIGNQRWQEKEIGVPARVRAVRNQERRPPARRSER